MNDATRRRAGGHPLSCFRFDARPRPRARPWLLGAACGFAAGSAFAAPWVVTSASDDVADTGSLRHAIVNAASGDTITFDIASYPAVIQLTGDVDSILTIRKNLTITGPGASQLTIRAFTTQDSNYNVFNVYQADAPTADIYVAISGLRIENGGAGVWSSGYGYGTAFTVHLALSDLVMAGNIDGIDVDYFATATISNTTISGGDFGVNVYSDTPEARCDVTIDRSALYDNLAAVYNANGNVTISNSTLSNNGYADTSTSFFAAVVGDVGSTTNLVFSTVSGSPSIATNGLFAYDAGAVFNLKNSLVANHAGGNCAAQVASLDHNLSDDDSCGLVATHDLNGTAAGLDPAGLADNGGPTPTIALLPASAAMDAVPLADCTDAQDTPVIADQRGFLRPVGSACEIGAWELNDAIFSSGFD